VTEINSFQLPYELYELTALEHAYLHLVQPVYNPWPCKRCRNAVAALSDIITMAEKSSLRARGIYRYRQSSRDAAVTP